MWLQSLVRDDADRETLFRLDIATQRVALGRIEHKVACRQFDRLRAVHLLDDQFAAVVVIRL